MRGVHLILIIGFLAKWGVGQYLNNRPYPTYSLERMPDTEFSCRGKILGGYYADPETQCQMFHVCVKVASVGVQDFRFLCPNGTAFDQDHQICAEWDDVDCDSTTLYYSSDNFDLYRIGSGFESKAVKYGEDEEPFALQRAETGDVRVNREHQIQRVNQEKEYNTLPPRNYNVQNRHRQPVVKNTNKNTDNNNNNNNNNDREIFRGSSSSNFFNNRNGGKDTEDDEYDNANVNANQNEDRGQRRKVIRKQNRRPVNDQFESEKQPEEENTPRSSRPTGFVNNFAGSSYVPTTPRSVSTTNTIDNSQYTTALNNHRARQRHRERQYSNTENFRQPSGRSYENNPQQNIVSTPAPFRQTNRQQYNPTSTENYPSSVQFKPQNQPRQNYNNQYNPPKQTENYPTVNQQQQKTTPLKEAENYPSTSSVNNNRNTQSYTTNYDVQKIKVKQTENYPTTPVFKQNNNQYKQPVQQSKQTDYYPTTFSPKSFPTKAPISKDYPTTFSPKSTFGFTQNSQQTSQTSKQNTPSYTSQQYNQNTQKYSPPSTQYYNNQNTKQNTPTTQQQYSTQNAQNTQYNTQNTQNAQNTQYNTQTTRPIPNTQSTQYNNNQYTPSTNYNPQYDNTHSTNGQYTFKSSQPTAQQRQTTQYTQYTPTVPKVTTPFSTSTTPANRFSNRFDETQYDDGSYNPKYDNYDNSQGKIRVSLGDEEFLKTAQSTNIANSRNELAKTTKNTVVSTTQKPRPFSVTPNSPQTITYTKTTLNAQNTAKPVQNPSTTQKPTGKKTKDTNYDYAYYDSNDGNEPEYDIGTDIAKSGRKNAPPKQ